MQLQDLIPVSTLEKTPIDPSTARKEEKEYSSFFLEGFSSFQHFILLF